MLQHWLTATLSALVLSGPLSSPANVQQIASPQAATEWRAQVTQTGGSTAYCLPNARVVVRIKGEVLMLHIAANERVAMTIALEEDGSAAAETVLQLAAAGVGARCRARIIIPAGSGPRSFEIVTYSQGCRYRVEPASAADKRLGHN